VTADPRFQQLMTLQETIARGHDAQRTRDDIVSSTVRYGYLSVEQVSFATGMHPDVIAALVEERYPGHSIGQATDDDRG
jgi:hypothetical protein